MDEMNPPLRSALQARRQGRPLLLLLDYDGTLVHIAPQPQLARPSPMLLELLGHLVSQPDLKVMIVSGRPLQDLQELLPIPGLDLLGSHGGEALIGGNLYPLAFNLADRQELSRWRHRLAVRLQPFQGWWLEDKPQGFALHYRQVPEEHAYEFIEILGRWREQLRQEGRLQLLAGKKVLEVLPLGIGKGTALQAILSLLPDWDDFLPIYIGDDVTDESAFQMLRHKGLTIKVGRAGTETAASYFLPDPEAVYHFLARLAAPREER